MTYGNPLQTSCAFVKLRMAERRWANGMINARMSLLAAVLTLIAAATSAGEGQDQMFATAVLDSVPAGATLVYGYDRHGAFDTAALPRIDGGNITLTINADPEGTREAVLAIDDTRRTIRPDPFGAAAGNPVLLVFMEDLVRAISTLTGGSPFYIRNRLRDALRGQDTTEPAEVSFERRTWTGTRLVFEPFFDEDPARFGPLAPLVIEFVVDGDVPGRFAKMRAYTPADTGGARYFEMMVTLEGLEGTRPR